MNVRQDGVSQQGKLCAVKLLIKMCSAIKMDTFGKGTYDAKSLIDQLFHADLKRIR